MTLDFLRRVKEHIGGPLSRLLADLIIQKIEKKKLQHLKWEKRCDWIRLMDGTLSGWESEVEFEDFF